MRRPFHSSAASAPGASASSECMECVSDIHQCVAARDSCLGSRRHSMPRIETLVRRRAIRQCRSATPRVSQNQARVRLAAIPVPRAVHPFSRHATLVPDFETPVSHRDWWCRVDAPVSLADGQVCLPDGRVCLRDRRVSVRTTHGLSEFLSCPRKGVPFPWRARRGESPRWRAGARHLGDCSGVGGRPACGPCRERPAGCRPPRLAIARRARDRRRSRCAASSTTFSNPRAGPRGPCRSSPSKTSRLRGGERAPLASALRERGVVEDAAARDVGERRSGLHQRELRRSHEVVRLRRVGRDDHEVVGRAHQVVQRAGRVASSAAFGLGREAVAVVMGDAACRSRHALAWRWPARCDPCRGCRRSVWRRGCRRRPACRRSRTSTGPRSRKRSASDIRRAVAIISAKPKSAVVSVRTPGRVGQEHATRGCRPGRRHCCSRPPSSTRPSAAGQASSRAPTSIGFQAR